MCLQITYTLTCEHVQSEIKFCADAVPASSASGSSSSAKRDKKKKGSSSHHRHQGAPSTHMIPCANLQQMSQPYPTPPSFAGDPATAAASLLMPKCPLPDCPFESKNRRWNCCWCGKAWNEYGRCSCTMIIEGNYVQCEHICCPACEAADR